MAADTFLPTNNLKTFTVIGDNIVSLYPPERLGDAELLGAALAPPPAADGPDHGEDDEEGEQHPLHTPGG